MEQLLEIKTIPIKYELKVQNASLEYQNSTAEVEISRDKGGMKIKSRPIKLHLDTYEARNSVVPTTKTAISQNAQKGQSAAYSATASFVREGQCEDGRGRRSAESDICRTYSRADRRV